MVIEDKQQEMKVKHLFQSAQDLAKLIELRTNGLSKCTIKFDKGDHGTDSAAMYLNVEKKPCYFNHEMFGYFTRKNILNYQLKMDNYDKLLPTRSPETFKDLMKKLHDSNYFKATYLGYQFKYDKWAS
jgi:hypothetical protein